MNSGGVRQLLLWLDALAAPPLCPLCRKDTAPAAELCPACRQRLPALPERRCCWCGGGNDGWLDVCSACASGTPRPWFRGVAAFPYAEGVRLGVHQFKYRGQCYWSDFFGREMAAAWRQHGAPACPQLVVPVPLHWRRQWLRGYNQSALLAAGVAARLQLPWRQVLRRARPTPRQAGLSRADRLHNLRGAVVLRRRAELAGLSLLLVDDVFTTGSTLAECCRALLAGGAAEVNVLTIARD